MARSLSIAAYLAGRGSEDPGGLSTMPPRPSGAVIWARCSRPDQLTAVEVLGRRLSEDGDPVQIITTTTVWDRSLSARALPEPKGKQNVRSFIDHWKPVIVLWVRSDLDPVLLDEIRQSEIPCMMLDADADRLGQVAGRWLPGLIRSLLAQFEIVLAIDQSAAEQLIRAGTPQHLLRISGAMEDCGPPLTCNEDDRQGLATAIGTRPIWLAASIRVDEVADLCTAHHIASSRAHRLLLVIVPAEPAKENEIKKLIQAANLKFSCQSEGVEPAEQVQVYIADTDDELGLWYRIAPITYLGGTLRGGGCHDPFEPAALGSAVLYGPHITPYERHAARLNAAGASLLLRNADDLGSAIESLLAADKAATLAHAAWDVTSRGADVTNRIVAMLQRRLEELGH